MMPRTDSIDPMTVASTTIVVPSDVWLRASLNCWTSGSSQSRFSEPYTMLTVTDGPITLPNAPHALNNKERIIITDRVRNFILYSPSHMYSGSVSSESQSRLIVFISKDRCDARIVITYLRFGTKNLSGYSRHCLQ